MVSLFFTTKSYLSSLVAELSQLCYISVLRSVALGSTDGLCTWICIYLLGLQPVLVPAGRISLGRIFNVVGAIIDRYLGFSLSSQFNTLLSMENHSLDSLILIQYRCIESHEPYSYALCYQNLIIDRLKPIANNLDFKLFDQHQCFTITGGEELIFRIPWQMQENHKAFWWCLQNFNIISQHYQLKWEI